MQQFIYGKQPSQVTPAGGIKGILCHSGNGKYFLRVPDKNNKDGYIDYALMHDDLSVTIDPSELASLYSNKNGNFLDHSPQVFALKPVEPELQRATTKTQSAIPDAKTEKTMEIPLDKTLNKI